MTIQEELAQARLEKQRKDIHILFNKLNNICEEEAGMPLIDVLHNYDFLTDNLFSTMFNIGKEE
tara:strand:- start:619 stop:810 length:192 start_codon:yes stop_codon:yes gene_type:complete